MVSADDALQGAPNGHARSTESESSESHLKKTFAKYEEEKLKRIRPDGPDQYVELKTLSQQDTRLRSLDDDIFVNHDALNAQEPNLKDGDEVKMMILGGGIGGVTAAAHVLKKGIFEAEDIRIVDRAGDFGGLWYFNRYPGVKSDVHSCLYLPMLDDTGYAPKNRHSSGEEIREYFGLLARRFNLYRSAVFRTDIMSMEWDESRRRWSVTMIQNRGPNEKPLIMTVLTQFFIWAGGLLTHPKLPKVPGLEGFRGPVVHTARWDYNLTGGSAADPVPVLSKLKDKKVAVIGSGASGIQATRELARSCGHLYVIHRTPPPVDRQGQRPIDARWFKELSSQKGWWRHLNDQYTRLFEGEEVPRIIADKYTEFWQYRHFLGARHDKEIPPEEVPAFMESLLKKDLKRMDRLRHQIDEAVDDPKTANHLKPWHSSWCKRPLFHDDYYTIFNQSNVSYIPTDGKGVESITHSGVVAGGKEYKVDFIVYCTGYRPFGRDAFDPSARSDMIIKGRGGRTLSEKWKSDPGPASFHGILSNSFPNLFFLKPDQGVACVTTTYCVDLVAEHIALILESLLAKADDPERLAVESTVEAQEDWVAEVARGATWLAPQSACGPSMMNNELKKVTPAEMARMSRSIFYTQGPTRFAGIIKAWRDEGNMQGLMIRS